MRQPSLNFNKIALPEIQPKRLFQGYSPLLSGFAERHYSGMVSLK